MTASGPILGVAPIRAVCGRYSALTSRPHARIQSEQTFLSAGTKRQDMAFKGLWSARWSLGAEPSLHADVRIGRGGIPRVGARTTRLRAAHQGGSEGPGV